MVPVPLQGPVPDRAGWTQFYDFGYLPLSLTRNDAGDFDEFEFDLAWKYTQARVSLAGNFLVHPAIRLSFVLRSSD